MTTKAKFQQSGTGAINRVVDLKLAETLSVKDFGAVGDGTTDDTAAIQAAIDAAVSNKAKVLLPSGVYLVTSSISLPIGSNINGVKSDQYAAGYTVQPLATTINFAPTVSNSDLFVANGTSHGGFRFHYSVAGIYLKGNANSRYALNLDHVIYGKFQDLSIEGFATPVLCNGTINNRFSNIYLSGTSECVLYLGDNETTDVWEQCSFWGSPIGVRFAGSSIGIRFNSPLFEQLTTYGMHLAKECQSITVVNGYAEDVPYANVSTNAMFKVGYAGTTVSNEYQLVVIGGKYAGRNAGVVGSFLDCDYSNGVMLQGVTHSRFTTIINTTTNTRASSIAVGGGSGISWTTYTSDASKISGVYPNGVNNSGVQSQTARFASAVIPNISDDVGGSSISLAGGAITVAPGAANALYPTVNNTVSLGVTGQRWKKVSSGNLELASAIAAAPAAGVIAMGNDLASSATAGTSGATPAQVAGYFVWLIGSTAVKVPYYNV